MPAAISAGTVDTFDRRQQAVEDLRLFLVRRRRCAHRRTRVIDRTDTATFDAFVRATVSDKVSLLTTDEHSGYRHLSADYPHGVIRHGAGQYVIGSIHTNTIEGFWSILKRGVVGTFHMVSKKYLPLYVAEFQFRYNNRHNPDIFGEALAGC